jgi:hypothetical protein
MLFGMVIPAFQSDCVATADAQVGFPSLHRCCRTWDKPLQLATVWALAPPRGMYRCCSAAGAAGASAA